MKKSFVFSVAVSTNDDINADDAAKILKLLIECGFADAKATLASDEGDVELAKLASGLDIADFVELKRETSVPVNHWGAYPLTGGTCTHQFDINDQRKENGQAYVTVGSIEGGLDDMLSMTMKVSQSPINEENHVPCAHVHFDADAMAFSLFKIGDKILLRPENGVSFSVCIEEKGCFWID